VTREGGNESRAIKWLNLKQKTSAGSLAEMEEFQNQRRLKQKRLKGGKY